MSMCLYEQFGIDAHQHADVIFGCRAAAVRVTHHLVPLLALRTSQRLELVGRSGLVEFTGSVRQFPRQHSRVRLLHRLFLRLMRYECFSASSSWRAWITWMISSPS